MLEYLNFCLICALFTLILYLYIRIKKYFPLLKMAEELIGNLSYETPQSDTKRQNSLNVLWNWGCLSSGGYRWSWLLHLSNQERRATTKNKPHPQTQPQTNKFEMD